MPPSSHRLLIVDDNRSIHEDFRKILIAPPRNPELIQAEAALFGQTAEPTSNFELHSAFQGLEALTLAEAAKVTGTPYSLAFVDVRMPPGIDGIVTATRLWAIDPDLQIVICTAYADHSWGDMALQLGRPDQWVILRKPFDNIEVLQLAHALTAKWALLQQNKRQLADLELRVQARTVELTRAVENLRQETKERARSEEERRTLERKFEETQRLESLGVLAGGIAHDFNNILTGVLGSASLARLEIDPGSPLDDHLTRIERSACRAAELCEQMLAYAGKGQVVVRSIHLNELVHDTLELLHMSVPKDANLTVNLAPTLPLVTGDPARVRQVLMNLVINAAEALTTPPRRVSLSTRVVSLGLAELEALLFPGDAVPGDFVCVEVADTGSGMSQETLRRIFEPFYTTKFTGRGLGLCAVQGILRSRGGALHVVTDVGQGSTFRAFFPVPRITQPELSKPVPPRTRRASSGTILVVDDESAVREISAAALRRSGFHVLTAADGVEAVKLVKTSTEAIDGVLLDLTMPQLDGVSTLKALRALRPELPAVLMSGYDQQEALQRFDGLGLAGFLQKPFTLDSLRDKVSILATVAHG